MIVKSTWLGIFTVPEPLLLLLLGEHPPGLHPDREAPLEPAPLAALPRPQADGAAPALLAAEHGRRVVGGLLLAGGGGGAVQGPLLGLRKKISI